MRARPPIVGARVGVAKHRELVQITKASQCMCPRSKFIMTVARMFNLDNKQTGGSPRAS